MDWKNLIAGCSIVALMGALLTLPATAATSELSNNTKTSVVLIANYNQDGEFTGWGTGFFVDEGIVVTNKHVVEAGYYYRVFSTNTDGSVDMKCYRTLGRSGVKINRDDDVAYVRAYVDCPHGTVYFAAADPAIGDPIEVLGYPLRGTFAESLDLSRVTGAVTGAGDGPWMTTDAFLDFGNSGGPVVKGDRVVGVAVAKTTAADGSYVQGHFVPVSEILRGLENANDPSFGYVPQGLQRNPAYQAPGPGEGPATNEHCALVLGQGGQAADDGGCRCGSGYRKDPTGTACLRMGAASSSSSSSSASSLSSPSSSSSRPASSRSSSQRSRASSRALEPAPSNFRVRVCDRVLRSFGQNDTMLGRVNSRLLKRFGFRCG
jgi:hypothetical protein